MSDHVSRFFTRIDKYVGELHPGQRGAFLRMQLDSWEQRYLDFQRKVDAGRTVTGVDAADYVVTIAGLDQRLAAQQAVL